MAHAMCHDVGPQPSCRRYFRPQAVGHAPGFICGPKATVTGLGRPSISYADSCSDDYDDCPNTQSKFWRGHFCQAKANPFLSDSLYMHAEAQAECRWAAWVDAGTDTCRQAGRSRGGRVDGQVGRRVGGLADGKLGGHARRYLQQDVETFEVAVLHLYT